MPARRPKGVDPSKYPNLAADRDRDRAEHVRLAMQAGMSREAAERHADEDLLENED